MSADHRFPSDQRQILHPDGSIVDDAAVPNLSDDQLISMYRQMKLARHFDERAVSLQRQGRIGTYPPLAGQEGAQVGSAMALDDEDWLFPSYREHAAKHARGVALDSILRFWMGDERGNHHEGLNVFPDAISIAGQIPHATGAAWAARLRDDAEAYLCYFGDGATSEGDFHEALNFAGVFDTPNVFFCNNNQWAISVPRDQQSSTDTLAQKAIAYGFEGVRVDGMDPLAVYEVTRSAVEKAKNPSKEQLRPTLIEAVQYRYGAHTTADDPSVYRDEAEVDAWKERDPISRLEQFLLDSGRIDATDVDSIAHDVEATVADAIETAEAKQEADPAGMFEHTYSEITDRLERQRDHFEALHERYGDEVLTE